MTDPVTPAAADEAVSVLGGGRYELGPLIGRGGSSEVYRGLDRSLHRHVAIKVLHGRQAHPGQDARFDREARLLATLQHPRVIPLLDAGREGERRYLVMPLIEGPTLAERIAAGPIPGLEVERVGTALADALAHIHAHGIAHRDVKPSNVLLGNLGQVLLTDFGIARSSACDNTATMSDLVTGTVAYMAPEQLEGSETGFACDVYALGLVLLESLTGVRVFEGRGTPFEQALARRRRLPVIPVSLGTRWQDLIGAMTQRDPAHRPGSRTVAGLLIEGMSAPPPVMITRPSTLAAAQAPGARPPSRANARRRWTAPVIATLCGVLTACSLTIMAFAPTPARAAVPPHTAQPSTIPATAARLPASSPADDSIPSHFRATGGDEGAGGHKPRPTDPPTTGRHPHPHTGH